MRQLDTRKHVHPNKCMAQLQIVEFVGKHRNETYTLQFQMTTPISGDLALYHHPRMDEPVECYSFQDLEEWKLTMKWVERYFSFEDVRSSSSGSEGLLRMTVSECPICLDALVSAKDAGGCSRCSARWHRACFQRWKRTSEKEGCPICSAVQEEVAEA